MRNDKERLLDILESINVIEKNLLLRKIYELHELEFIGIVRCIEIIGEACRCISDILKNQYSNVLWREIANMRNILVHQYFEVDHDKIAKVIEKDLPLLKEQVEKILEDFNE